MGATTQKLRIAVFGAGLAFAPHRDSLRDLADRIDVAWFVGSGIDRVQQAAAHFPGARATTAIDDVLADASVQAALVLTPPASHLDIVERLAARGIHVLLEKPLALDTPGARALVEACERHRVVLALVLQHRLRPAALQLKQLLAAGALGTLTRAAVDVRWWRPQSYYDMPGRGTLARDGGGVLMTQAIHTLDLFLHLAGPVHEVAALAATSPAHRMECEDVVAAVARLGNGAVASLHATTAAFPGFAESIELSGTLGTARLTGGELVMHGCDGAVQRWGEDASLGAGADPMAFDHAAHRAVLADFVEAVRHGAAPSASGRSALAVHRLIDALLASSATRRFVPLDATESTP
jgi:predicted dehydrogenase